MSIRFAFALVWLFAALVVVPVGAQNAASQPAPAALPAGTHAGHRLLVGDYDKHLVAIVSPAGDIEWQSPVHDIHDAALLENGNVLFQTDFQHIVEMTPEHRVVWQYDAAASNGNAGRPVEVHAFQRLPQGITMLAESGPARIIEVDAKGRLERAVPLKVEHPATHTDTRLVRKLDSGNYLVAHEGDNQVVREYDPTGRIVWEYRPGSKVYSAIRLPSGNTLIGCGDGHRVEEVDAKGRVVWSVTEHDLKDIQLAWVTMVERLASGNTIIVNCHAGPANPQVIEVTPDKKVVWTFKDFNHFGNAVAVARVID